MTRLWPTGGGEKYVSRWESTFWFLKSLNLILRLISRSDLPKRDQRELRPHTGHFAGIVFNLYFLRSLNSIFRILFWSDPRRCHQREKKYWLILRHFIQLPLDYTGIQKGLIQKRARIFTNHPHTKGGSHRAAFWQSDELKRCDWNLFLNLFQNKTTSTARVLEVYMRLIQLK